MINRKIEILAPAGSYESLVAAVTAGADAVYIGGSKFGARAYANNLDEEKMLDAIDYVHLHGRKIFLTVNTLLKDDELSQLYDYLLPYYKQGLDAVIVQDMGVLEFVKKHFPDLAIHASTQMTITNEAGASFFKDKGVERVVPARELSLSEVRQMKEATGLEIECFVHGALCYCYSGQCLLSSMIGGRSGNRGQCAQPCRLPYSVNGSKPQDILSLKDLCTIEMIPDLIEAGIDSFKIEGRMKQPEYVYTVVSMYRKYVDLYLAKGKEKFKVHPEDLKKLQGIYRRRGYCEGYYKQHNGKNMISLKRPDDSVTEIQIPADRVQEKISGNLVLQEGANAVFTVSYKDYHVTCEGAEVQSALKQPLDVARIEKQMRKTGATEFCFDELDIWVEGNIFMPMQALNELRRDVIDTLEKEILQSYRRQEAESLPADEADENSGNNRQDGFHVLVQTYEQLKQVMNHKSVTAIYVDSNIAFSEMVQDQLIKNENDQKIYCAMPYIFRKSTISKFESMYQQIAEKFDGVVVRNWETYVWLKRKNYSKEMISDYNMYTFNRAAKRFHEKEGFMMCTAPVELNAGELKKLDISGEAMIVYGYQPVMISAGCVQKNTDKCTQKEGILYLTDRYHKKFAVKNYCKCCYNVIYNSSPLLLIGQKEEFEKLKPACLRLDFSIETGEETKTILEMFEDNYLGDLLPDISDIDYTKGHFRRGVK